MPRIVIVRALADKYIYTPVIARDIPVFREVASQFAYYFENDTNPLKLAKAIEEWLSLYKEHKHPKSEGMKYLTWKENVKRLLEVILDER